MRMLDKLKLSSGWYRVLIIISILWMPFALLITNPWVRSVSSWGREGRRGRGEAIVSLVNNWDEFILIGIIPPLLFWGIIWIVKGFKQNNREVQDENP